MTHRSIIIAGAMSVGLLFAASPASAQAYDEYPWCGYVNMAGGQSQSCTFSTLQQCQAFVSPNGYCDTNPRGSLARGGPARAYGQAYSRDQR